MGAGEAVGLGPGSWNSDLLGAGEDFGSRSSGGNGDLVGAGVVLTGAADCNWKKLGISAFRGGENIVVSSIGALCAN